VVELASPGAPVFEELDYTLWKVSGHNPVKLMREVTAEKTKKCGRGPGFS